MAKSRSNKSAALDEDISDKESIVQEEDDDEVLSLSGEETGATMKKKSSKTGHSMSASVKATKKKEIQSEVDKDDVDNEDIAVDTEVVEPAEDDEAEALFSKSTTSSIQ